MVTAYLGFLVFPADDSVLTGSSQSGQVSAQLGDVTGGAHVVLRDGDLALLRRPRTSSG